MRATGPGQDIEDVRGILAVSQKVLDLNLLRRLARRYGPDVEVQTWALVAQNPPEPEAS
jgi:hypothetical protein